VWAVDRSPAVLGSFEQLERHRQPGGPGAGSQGGLGPQPDPP
jgi:hypothetical protein